MRKPVFRIPLMAPLLALSAATLLAGDVKNTSYRLSTGERVLRHEALVAASPARVWEAFSTGEGLRSFVAPVAAIDLRVGGIWEASYDPARKIGQPGNIKNEILAFLPERLLAIRIQEAPPGFPFADIAKDVHTVILLEEAAPGTTKVEVAMLPFKDGKEWDGFYRFFDNGNAAVLRNLQRRFQSGPIDWSAELARKPK